MKTIISLLTLVSLNATAFNCNSYEAQFTGTISSLEQVSAQCTYKVKVSQVWEHIMCPLSQGEIENSSFSVPAINNTCPYQIDQALSGILVQDNDGTMLLD